MKRFYLETEWKDENGEKLEIINDPDPIAAIKIENKTIKVFHQEGKNVLEVTTRLEVDTEDELGETVHIISSTKFADKNFSIKTPINIVALAEIVHYCIKHTEDLSDNKDFLKRLDKNIELLSQEIFKHNPKTLVSNTELNYQVEALSNGKIFGMANSCHLINNKDLILNDFVSSVDIDNVKQPITLKLYNGNFSFDISLDNIGIIDCENQLIKISGNIVDMLESTSIDIHTSENIADKTAYIKEKLRYIKDKKTLNDDISFLEDLFI